MFKTFILDNRRFKEDEGNAFVKISANSEIITSNGHQLLCHLLLHGLGLSDNQAPYFSIFHGMPGMMLYVL